MLNAYEIKTDIIFEPKAEAVPYNYRISYKVSLLCLIMSKSCGRKGCSTIKMQIISHASASQRAQKELLSLLNYSEGVCIIRFDPSINRAIHFALVSQVMYRQGNGLYKLTEKGKLLVKKIDADESLLSNEKEFLTLLSTRLTEEIIERWGKEWGAKDVKN